MPRNITLTFDDGSTHVYNNAPDNVTPDQIEARAQTDFAGKRVTNIDGGRRAAAPAPAPAPAPVADIPGTPQGYAARVAAIPGAASAPAPQAPPAGQPGVVQKIVAGLQAARQMIGSIVPGGVGMGLGAAEGLIRSVASGKIGTAEGANLVEQTASKRAQQFTEATVTPAPSPLAQEYVQDVGDFMTRHGASVAAGPLGVVGLGKHSENVRNARAGLRAGVGGAGEGVPGLAPAPEAAAAPAKPGLGAKVVQPNPALLEAVPAAEKAGLTVLPHHVAESDTVRALGTAAGGDVYKQNTKAFTKALIKELDPDETAPRLDTKVFHRVLDKNGRVIGENMARYDLPVGDDVRSRLEAISKDAADNADADTGRMTMNRVNEILGKAEAGSGAITGQAARELDTAIGRQIRSNTKNPDLIARLRAVQDVLRDTAEGQMTPDEAAATKAARRRYAYAMEILPDIDDFGRTGYYEPGQLWKRLTSSEAGRQRVANERGGLTDLAKAGALVADRSGVGHGYVSVGQSGVGVGTSGMRAYASPSKLLEVGVGVVGGKRAYNRFGPALVKRLAAEHDAEMARANAKPPEAPLELAPEGEAMPQAARPETPAPDAPDWTTEAGAGVAAPGAQIPAVEPEGLLPAVGDDMPPARLNPEPRARVPDIPAVPGRPDLPDVMVTGAPREVAATEATGKAMQTPEAALAREQQGLAPGRPPEPPKGGGDGGGTPPAPLDPRLAKIAELRKQATSPAVKKVLDAREAEVKKAIKREQDVADLEAAAQATDDPGLRQALLAEADNARGGKIPVGEVKEGQPDLPAPKAEKIPVGKVIEGQPELPAAPQERLPVGEATEIAPEVVEAAPERLPVGEATEMPEPLPVGEVTENPIPTGEAMEFDQMPVGEATEITPEVVAPEGVAPQGVVPEATNVDNPPTAPAGGGRSGSMEQSNASQEVAQQAGVPAEPQGRAEGRAPAEAGAGDRVPSAAGGEAKAPATLTAKQINTELDRLDAEHTAVTDELIAAGRGTERASETVKKADPLSKRLAALQERYAALHAEIETRYGSRVSRLPERGFGPREKADAPKAPKPATTPTGAGERAPSAAGGEAKAPEVKRTATGTEAILYETPNFHVRDAGSKGYAVYQAGATASTKVASIGHGKGPGLGLERAKAEADRRQAALSKPASAPKPATTPAGKTMSPAEVKAEFQRQIDAVPRFDAGGPETITLKAGGSSARIQNTARRVAEYMQALDTVKGGKTPKPMPERKTGIDGTKVTVPAELGVIGSKPYVKQETKTWGGDLSKRADLTVIEDMIDDLDPQAAVDYAAAQGIDLEEALKGDKRRLSHVQGRKPTPETP